MISDTVIPSKVDSTAVDGVSIDLNSNSKLEIKQTWENNNITIPLAQQEIEIIELQATATVTPIDHDSFVSDTFSDATGYKNSVATGTTTAIFSVNKYNDVKVIFADNCESGSLSDKWDTSAGTIEYSSDKAKTGSKSLRLTGSGGYSCATGKNVLSITSFPTTLEFYYYDTGNAQHIHSCGLITSSTQELTINKTSASATNYVYRNSASATYVDTGVAFSLGWHLFKFVITSASKVDLYIDNTKVADQITTMVDYSSTQPKIKIYTSSGSENYMYVDNFQVYEGNIIGQCLVDITLPTITGTVTHTELLCNCPDRETGDNVTYKLKNATQSDTSLALNTKNAVTNLTSVPTGIEINLIPKNTDPTLGTPSVKSYCLKLWKS